MRWDTSVGGRSGKSLRQSRHHDPRPCIRVGGLLAGEPAVRIVETGFPEVEEASRPSWRLCAAPSRERAIKRRNKRSNDDYGCPTLKKGNKSARVGEKQRNSKLASPSRWPGHPWMYRNISILLILCGRFPSRVALVQQQPGRISVRSCVVETYPYMSECMRLY